MVSWLALVFGGSEADRAIVYRSRFQGVLCLQQQTCPCAPGLLSPIHLHPFLFLCMLISFSLKNSSLPTFSTKRGSIFASSRSWRKGTVEYFHLQYFLNEERESLFSLVIRKMNKYKWSPDSGNKYLLFHLCRPRTGSRLKLCRKNTSVLPSSCLTAGPTRCC